MHNPSFANQNIDISTNACLMFAKQAFKGFKTNFQRLEDTRSIVVIAGLIIRPELIYIQLDSQCPNKL